MEIKFNQLLTKALEESATHFVTMIPVKLLNDIEKKYGAVLQKCAKEGWTPTLETFKEMIAFLPMQSEIPLKVLYSKFVSQRRDRYVAQRIAEFAAKNVENGLEEYDGIVEFQQKLLAESAVPNPEVIDYNNFNREVYQKAVYRSSFHLPYFDEMAHGLQGGDLVVIMAPTKVGKTTLLKWMTLGSFFKNEPSIFCSQEQAALSLAAQLDMQGLNKTHSLIRAGLNETDMSELKSFEKKIRGVDNKLYITPPVKSVAQLHEYLSALPCKTKKVFIDGLNVMQGDSADSFNALRTVCADLKAYAIEHDMIIIAVTQSNREGFKSGSNLGAQHIGGSFAISQYADILIAMSNLEENGKQYTYIRPILNRHGNLDTKIRMEMVYTQTGESWINLAKLLPSFGTEQPSEFSMASKELAAKIQTNLANIGVDFNEIVENFGKDQANALLNYENELETSEGIAF